jgi:cephalosporin hydroxylase
MNHFYESIDGWFSFKQIYRDMVNKAKDGSVFVEIGAWKGKSTSFMAVEILNSGKNIEFHTVDTFKGSDTEVQQKQIREGLNPYETFIKNLAPVLDSINVHVGDSVQVAKEFKDHSVDFVFIDGNHLYEYVKADIAAWLPKVKQGGVIAGDDWAHHDQVQKAVTEVFPNPEIINRSWFVNV